MPTSLAMMRRGTGAALPERKPTEAPMSGAGPGAGDPDWASADGRVTGAGRAPIRPFATLACWLRSWRERKQQRRELAMMGPRDFGDLQVSPAMIRDELRRWPWQKPRLVSFREKGDG